MKIYLIKYYHLFKFYKIFKSYLVSKKTTFDDILLQLFYINLFPMIGLFIISFVASIRLLLLQIGWQQKT